AAIDNSLNTAWSQPRVPEGLRPDFTRTSVAGTGQPLSGLTATGAHVFQSEPTGSMCHDRESSLSMGEPPKHPITTRKTFTVLFPSPNAHPSGNFIARSTPIQTV